MSSDRKPPGPVDRSEVRRAEEARAAAEERAALAILLFSAVARLHDARGLADVLSAIGEIAAGCLDTPDVAIYLPDGASGRPRRVHLAGPRAAALGTPTGALEALVDRAAAERRIAIGPELRPGIRDLAVPLGMAAPGVMVLFSVPLPGEKPSAELRQRLEIVGRHVGIALARAG